MRADRSASHRRFVPHSETGPEHRSINKRGQGGGVINTHCSIACGSRSWLMFFHVHPLQLLRKVSFISHMLCGLKKMPEIIAVCLQLRNLFFLTSPNLERSGRLGCQFLSVSGECGRSASDPVLHLICPKYVASASGGSISTCIPSISTSLKAFAFWFIRTFVLFG